VRRRVGRDAETARDLSPLGAPQVRAAPRRAARAPGARAWHGRAWRDWRRARAAQAAVAVNADGIHVLVDLNGCPPRASRPAPRAPRRPDARTGRYTLGARTEIVALRPAPLTLFDQGFAGARTPPPSPY
jgi:hypothetical protein